MSKLDWNKSIPAHLPLHVPDNARQWLTREENATIGNVYDLQGTRSGREQLVERIYSVLAARGIHYNESKDSYRKGSRSATQEIRTLREVLENPREGTCLDLALVFAALCLDCGLMPTIILVEGHAFAGVWLDHARRDWDLGTRRDWNKSFDPAKGLTRLDVLRSAVENGRLLPIECTGFVDSRSLDPKWPEGRGRAESDGRMTYVRACSAGVEQVEGLTEKVEKARPVSAERSFRFAVDIALARSKEEFLAGDPFVITPPIERLAVREPVAPPLHRIDRTPQIREFCRTLDENTWAVHLLIGTDPDLPFSFVQRVCLGEEELRAHFDTRPKFVEWPGSSLSRDRFETEYLRGLAIVHNTRFAGVDDLVRFLQASRGDRFVYYSRPGSETGAAARLAEFWQVVAQHVEPSRMPIVFLMVEPDGAERKNLFARLFHFPKAVDTTSDSPGIRRLTKLGEVDKTDLINWWENHAGPKLVEDVSKIPVLGAGLGDHVFAKTESLRMQVVHEHVGEWITETFRGRNR